MYNVYVRTKTNHMMAFWYSYKLFKPTGRWKIEVSDDEVAMYVEHKNFIFKEWVLEDNIITRWEETFVNECTK